jgi:hypothetical protein
VYLTLPGELDCHPYLSLFLRQLESTATFASWVDLGCGAGGPARKAASHVGMRRVAVDVTRPAECDGWQFVHADIQTFLAGSPADPRAVATMMDVLEHFDRPEGERVLTRIAELFGAQAVYTPLGFFQQDPASRPDLAPMPEMWHRSAWDAHDLEARDFLAVIFPMAHRRRGALLAVRRSGWSTDERRAIARSFRNLYLRRFFSPFHAYRRIRSAASFWFGDTSAYKAASALLRGR